jgi:hypothetical protein
MRQLGRTAAEIAELQLEELAARADLDRQAPVVSTAPVADLLVMGYDQRPYLVRRLVTRGGHGVWLCWVSVSDAGWGWWPSHPVVRMAITLPPRPAPDEPAVGPRARVWHDINVPRWPGDGQARTFRPRRIWQ